MSTVIKVENLSKRYRLGVINRDMLYKDLQSRWAKFRGKEDPNAPIGLKHDKRLEDGDEFWALRNVDLEVKEGEILGIIGRNGAGKSTLLKILSQITAPTEGRIKVKGRIASLLEVGTGFHPELTGRENIYLNGAILGMTRKEVRSKFDEIVAFAEIDEFIDTPVKRYSSGMYVRLAFAVAAHLDPEILIIDEVLAVGDADFQKKCLGRMQAVSNQGRTVLFVSHNMTAISKLCTRACTVEQGVLHDFPSVDLALKNYLGDSSRLDSKASEDGLRRASEKLQPYFEITTFNILDALGQPLNLEVDAKSNETIKLQVAGRWGSEIDDFNLGFVLENNSGDRLIVSYFTDMPRGEWPRRNKGETTTMLASIDTSWLVEGRYRIKLVASLHCVRMLITEADQIEVAFAVQGIRNQSTFNVANNRGVLLAPAIPWRFL
jgi:lipopolysaccharide transport system ATP-binding protein